MNDAITWFVRFAGVISAGFVGAKVLGYAVTSGNLWTGIAGIVLWLSMEIDFWLKRR